MIRLKSEAEIALLAEGGRRLGTILQRLAKEVRPGVKTKQLDQLAHELIVAAGDEPSFLGYRPTGARRPYPASLCVSVNEEVVHGIPGERVIQVGDIVSLDLGLRHQGLYTDAAITVPVGPVAPVNDKLLRGTAEALAAGIAAAVPGGHLGDIGAAVSAVAGRYGFGLVRELGGHGVGFKIHEEPLVPNEGERGQGPVLRPGLVIAIEPMLTTDSPLTRTTEDGYTIVTRDGSWSAHFEHTIAITASGPQILTLP